MEAVRKGFEPLSRVTDSRSQGDRIGRAMLPHQSGGVYRIRTRFHNKTVPIKWFVLLSYSFGQARCYGLPTDTTERLKLTSGFEPENSPLQVGCMNHPCSVST